MKQLVLSAALVFLSTRSALGQGPQPQWSIAVAVVGSNATTRSQSDLLFSKVSTYFETYRLVTIRGEIQRGLRSEIGDDAILRRARETDATGAVILQFQPARDRPSSGYAHTWVSTIAGPPRHYIEYIANIAGDIFEEAKRIAAQVIRTISADTYYLVELHVFTQPRDSFFTVGESTPARTDEAGRQANEGFKLWVGTRPAGVTSVRVYKPPDYQDHLEEIQLPMSEPEPFRIAVVVQLMRNP